ncbi:hypothetical protein EXIGLDRAFT_702572 [Exidia glandulosa HHB12029]|uniref:Uncharacterized protein n=1 Tax=Exidia glandulosa HHB12029 TaxID=1314781 RepID=A0A165ZG59_EXIGL|nr:hypothetical protein EXIGLDRAFT_702572 [Exidia glandulosa HHB12029]
MYAGDVPSAPLSAADNAAAGLCCGSVMPHIPTLTEWEPQFGSFLRWLAQNAAAPPVANVPQTCDFAIRVTTTTPQGFAFLPVGADYARTHGYTIRCAFKNYRCPMHSLYFQPCGGMRNLNSWVHELRLELDF